MCFRERWHINGESSIRRSAGAGKTSESSMVTKRANLSQFAKALGVRARKIDEFSICMSGRIQPRPAEGLKNDRVPKIRHKFGANMLHARPTFFAKSVKAQAVALKIDFVEEPCTQGCPLRRIHLALEH